MFCIVHITLVATVLEQKIMGLWGWIKNQSGIMVATKEIGNLILVVSVALRKHKLDVGRITVPEVT